ENTPLLRPRDSVYIGVVVKNTASDQTSVGDANVVVDSCWVTSQRHRRNIISNNGCTALYNGVTVLDNGRNSQARIKLSSEVFSFSSAPIYLQCSVYPCIGRDCSPDCTAQNNSESPPVWSIQNVTSAILPEKQKRAADDTVRQYDLTVGPVYAKDFWTHTLARPSP
uniref:ZP domain-containing protein n=1 Tax=Ciona savignyi TaxID=51511 RepID=H2ZBG8_CIOSA